VQFIIGLTGGIGSGKTSAADFFAGLGADIIDTDEIARELTQSNSAAIVAIKKIFGGAFITAEGALDRNKMRQLVFSDSISRQQLERILHPLICIESTRRVALSSGPYTIIVIPLLFETGDYNNMIQRILVVDCNEQAQIARTIERSKLDEQTVRAIMETQISRQDRLKKADDIIINNNDLAYLQKQVNKHHENYLTLSKQ
jgi:dephospho-CoA kinase